MLACTCGAQKLASETHLGSIEVGRVARPCCGHGGLALSEAGVGLAAAVSSDPNRGKPLFDCDWFMLSRASASERAHTHTDLRKGD
jgi:hypothetical protein